jgi:hypothetical protein
MANSPALTASRRPLAGHGARVAWTVVGLVLAITAVTLWVSTQIRTEFQNSYALIPPHQRTYPDHIRHLVVAVTSGTVTIERASGSATVVDTTGTRASTSPTDDEHLVGSTLYLRSVCGSPGQFQDFCTRDYRVRVPGDVAINASVTTGNLFISAIHGPVDATVGTGSVSVTGDVGPVHVATRSGSILVRREDGALNATTGTGAVFVAHARGPVTVDSANGGAVISGASTSVHVTAGTGSVTATGLAGSTFTGTVMNGNMVLSFTAAPHEVDASTQTGSITLHVPYADVRYQLHLKTATGRVVSAIPNTPSSTRVIRALAGNGDVILGVGVVPTPSTPQTPTSPGTPVSPTGPTGG